MACASELTAEDQLAVFSARALVVVCVFVCACVWGPWQDSSLQSLVPKAGALSIRPQGQLTHQTTQQAFARASSQAG